MKNKITIFGSSNIDYLGTCNQKIIYKDSNVGLIKVSFGGVGRNIVENLLRMGDDVTFFTAIGEDELGLKMQNELIRLGCNIIKPKTDMPSASYLAISDESGDMALALCDARINVAITKELIDYYHELINESDFIVIDTNLEKEVIEYIIDSFDKKIIVDGISTTKVLKIVDRLSKLYVLKVNELEYEVIKEYLKTNKPKYLVKSCGKDDICLIYNNKEKYISVPKVENIVSTTGAGDALISGIIHGLAKNLNIEGSINEGIKRATKTLLSFDSVCKDSDID